MADYTTPQTQKKKDWDKSKRLHIPHISVPHVWCFQTGVIQAKPMVELCRLIFGANFALKAGSISTLLLHYRINALIHVHVHTGRSFSFFFGDCIYLRKALHKYVHGTASPSAVVNSSWHETRKVCKRSGELTTIDGGSLSAWLNQQSPHPNLS